VGQDRLKSAFLVVAAGLLLPAAFFVQNDLGSENSAQPNTESKVEPTEVAQTGGAKSHARAVLLAGLMGKVTFTRPGSAGENPIVVNTPIQEGFRLSSSADSTAIIEFEHDSTALMGTFLSGLDTTALMGQHSELIFNQLALDPNSARLTGMTFEKGLATFHFLPQHHSPFSRDQQGGTGAARDHLTYADVYEIKTAEARVKVDGKCRFRIDVKGGNVRVEVFKGKVLFATPVQSIELTAGESLEHPLGGSETTFNIHKGIVKDTWDHWAEAQEQLVLSESNDASKKGREPEDLRAILKLRRSYPSTHGGETNLGPRAPHQ
jgi:hypothetical protein